MAITMNKRLTILWMDDQRDPNKYFKVKNHKVLFGLEITTFIRTRYSTNRILNIIFALK